MQVGSSSGDGTEEVAEGVHFTVSNGASVGVTACSGSVVELVVMEGGTATITTSSRSFATGVPVGLTVQNTRITGVVTATGTTFQAADDATVAVSVEEGGQFNVESSQLVGADGAG
jgi:hypothetical protein